MVEFINKLTESQASDKVHKVLRSDPDKKRNQPDKEESSAKESEKQEELKDELMLSSSAGSNNDKQNEKTEEAEIEVKNEEDAVDAGKDVQTDGHIDVTA